MSQLLRVHNFMVSADGFGAGEGQSLERPFGTADPAALASWFGATANSPNRTEPGGTRGIDDLFTRDWARNIGAEIMGRNKFGPIRGEWHDVNGQPWRGWWGEEPPFHTPVFVMTHFPRESLTVGETTFHFVAGTPAEIAERALAAADGQDVRIGGGVQTMRAFLDAGLVDSLHFAVVPGVTIGAGERVWNSPTDLEDRYHHEELTSPSGVQHHLFWRD